MSYHKNILRHAVATLKQAALPLRNRHFTTHAQAFALSAHRAAARQTIFRQRLRASLLFNTVHARSYWLRTLDKPMNSCTPIFILMKNYFLLLARRLCLSLSARAHEAEVDGIFYNLDAANKTATVTFKGDDPYSYNEYSGDVVIPETVTYNGITYSVTSLGDHCFYGCRRLTSITIPNSVTSVGRSCFSGCSSLTSITIPNSVTTI